MKSIRILSVIFLAAILLVSSSSAQNQLDLSFNAVPSKATVDFPKDKGQVVQPDGKIIVWGGNLAAGGLAKGYVARLNPDGSVDPSFTYCSCQFIGFINAIVQPDGKILLAGVSATSQGMVVRLNSDGSIDSGFNSQIPVEHMTTARARVWAVQLDGKVLVSRDTVFTTIGTTSQYMYRLNADGSMDSGFTTFQAMVFVDLKILPDGKILYATRWVGGGSNNGGSVERRNADGTPDSSWTSPALGQPPGPTIYVPLQIYGASPQPDGSVIMTGRFYSVNGVAREHIARLLPGGNVDLGFTAPALGEAFQPYVLPSGKILVTVLVDSNGTKKLYRLNSNGSLDNTFRGGKQEGTIEGKDVSAIETLRSEKAGPEDTGFLANTVLNLQNRFEVDGADKIYFFGNTTTATGKFFRLNPDGSEDAGFIPNVAEFGKVYDIARQPDGKYIIIGEFVQVGGVSRSRIARINSNGTLDATFDPGTGFSSLPRGVRVMADGKILVFGAFDTYNGAAVGTLVKLNSDGSRDTSFALTSVGGVGTVSFQPDGKIVVGGSISSINGTARTGVARIDPDGTLDPAFNPLIGGNPDIRVVIASPDGKITFFGTFNGVNGFNRTGAARLNSDGTLDESFTLGSGLGSSVVVRARDGKYIAASGGSVIRINANGSSDSTYSTTRFTKSFNDSSPRISDIELQSNGKLLVGGFFYEINDNTNRFNLVRLNPNGGLDTSYAQKDPNGSVRTLLLEPNGKFMAGGDFYAVEGTTRAGIARIDSGEAARRSPFDFDGDGRSDISVYRPSDNNWYLMQSTGGFAVQHFGISTDRVASADYDGDGKSDIAIYRDGAWWYINSSNGTVALKNWGGAGNLPMPSDFDGDGKADFIYYRVPTSSADPGRWFRRGSTGIDSNILFGLQGDIPVTGDFDGDNRSDPAIFRPSNGTWWYVSSVTNANVAAQWGQNGDIPVSGDFDGDNRTDLAVWRPSNGAWYIYNIGTGTVTIYSWGLAEDKPVVGDYDGDGKSDIAVWRPSTGVWYIMQSTSGFTGMQFGLSTDKAVPNAYLP